MRHLGIAFLTSATATLAAAAMTVLGLAVPAGAAQADQHVIVELRPSTNLAGATAEVVGDGGTIGRRYTKVFRGYAAAVSAAQLKSLQADPDVLTVVPDTTLHLTDTETGASWGLDRTDQRALPLDTRYTYNGTGAGVSVFVVDSGVRATHVEFGGRVAGGTDLVDGDADPADCNGHGTHVSGTIGGATYGIAKGVTIIPVRTFDCAGSASASTIVAGFEWVIAHRSGPAVVNFSAGGPANALIDAAAQAVIDAGITLVVAAGNDSDDSCFYSPARVPGALTVGASDSSDTAPVFSDYGDCIDLFAPGVYITSDWNTSDNAINMISGTSMSTPHVVGVAARYLQTHPAAAPAEVADYINGRATPGIVTDALSINNRLLYMDGGLDTGPPPPPPSPVTPTITGGQVTPNDIVFNNTQPEAYSVTVTSSQPLKMLSAYVRSPGSSYDFLIFNNPSSDGVTWTDSSVIYNFETRGVWTVSEYSALWADATGLFHSGTLDGFHPTVNIRNPDVAPPSPPSPPPPPAAPAPAPAPAVHNKIHVTKVSYNSPGADTKRNRNSEWVRITNTATTAYSLTDYRLSDHTGHTYTFPSTTLGAKKSIYVYTGKGKNTPTARYWNNAQYVWNNTGTESVTLRDSHRRTVSKHDWRSKRIGMISWP
jgi:subtilisin family serine protease